MAFATVTGKITQITIGAENWDSTSSFGRGLLTIYMAQLPPSPGPDQYRRVAITSDHPAYKEIALIASAAKSANGDVTLTYLQSHATRANSWDFGVLTRIG